MKYLLSTGRFVILGTQLLKIRQLADEMQKLISLPKIDRKTFGFHTSWLNSALIFLKVNLDIQF